MQKETRKTQITQILAKSVLQGIEQEKLNFDEIQEIRLRIGQPLIVMNNGGEYIVKKYHDRVSREEIRELLEYVSNYSLYAYEHELKQGFLTIEGGHRVGLAGQVIVEGGTIKNLKYISSVNIRVSHEIPGCADRVFSYLTEAEEICHTLIISPPGCGKTTLLRDMIRQISDGNRWVRGCAVGVVDERSELGGCYMGVPQNHLGMRTDILDGCPKAEGMMMLIRSMSPKVLAVDEIGTEKDVQAVEYAMHCGCRLIATVHGNSLEEIQQKPCFERLTSGSCFERYVVLGKNRKIGEIQGVYNRQGEMLYQEYV